MCCPFQMCLGIRCQRYFKLCRWQQHIDYGRKLFRVRCTRALPRGRLRKNPRSVLLLRVRCELPVERGIPHLREEQRRRDLLHRLRGPVSLHSAKNCKLSPPLRLQTQRADRQSHQGGI
mmetsp:Transcript_23935/g.45536  ORF Transcript_23935/g.45536 Transcript_23935/m.45536 type:complete len:119 (-) Transcript_23935:1838-2194(-)